MYHKFSFLQLKQRQLTIMTITNHVAQTSTKCVAEIFCCSVIYHPSFISICCPNHCSFSFYQQIQLSTDTPLKIEHRGWTDKHLPNRVTVALPVSQVKKTLVITINHSQKLDPKLVSGAHLILYTSSGGISIELVEYVQILVTQKVWSVGTSSSPVTQAQRRNQCAQTAVDSL